MPLSLPLFTLFDNYVVRDGVPGIVNANKEDQQRRSANDELQSNQGTRSRADNYIEVFPSGERGHVID
jgi:hypothetical protein